MTRDTPLTVPPEDLVRECWAYFYEVVLDFLNDWGTPLKLVAMRTTTPHLFYVMNGWLEGFAAYIRRMAMMDLADRGEELAKRKPRKKRKHAKRPRRPVDPEDPLTWRVGSFDWQLPGQPEPKRSPRKPSARAKQPPIEICTTLSLARKLERICRIVRDPERALRRLARRVFDRDAWIVQIAAPKNESPHARMNNAGIDVLFRRKFSHLLKVSIWDPG